MRSWFWAFDGAVVVSFAAIGRDSHGFGSDWEEVMRISAPFLIGLVIGAITRKAWLHPTSLVTGLWVGVATLVIGMLLRRFVFDDGTAAVFVLVTSAWIIGLMVGWRLVWTGIAKVVDSRT